MKQSVLPVFLGLAALLAACSSTSSTGGSAGTGGGDPGAGGEPGDPTLGDWTSFGRGLDHHRANPNETAISVDTVGDLELVWEHKGALVTSTPVISNGIVYYADWDGIVYAKNTVDGSEVWTTQPQDIRRVTSTVALTDDRVFVSGGDARAQALDRATGEILWSVKLEDNPYAGMNSSPMVVDDIIIVGVSGGELGDEKEDYTFQGSIVGLSQEDGSQLWKIYVSQNDETSGAGVSVWSSASIDPELQLAYIGTGQAYEEPAGPLSDALIAVDYVRGEIAWARQFTPNDVYRLLQPLPQGPDADIGAAPNLFSIDGRDVVGVGDKGGVYAVFDRLTGDPVWMSNVGPGSHLGGIMAPAAYFDGVLYMASNLWPEGFDTTAVFLPDFDKPGNESELIALDATNGDELWRVPVAHPTIGGTSYANGIVFSGHTIGLVQAFDARDGLLLWEKQVGDSLASGQVVSNGMLFVTHGFNFIGIVGGDPNTRAAFKRMHFRRARACCAQRAARLVSAR